MNAVELVRCIEEEFSIYLPNDELRDVYTVGNLYNLLLRKLNATPDCLTSRSFYQIRRALTKILGIPRRSIRPTTFLDDLFDQMRTRKQWDSVVRESGLKLPRLRHTAVWQHWLQILAAAFALMMMVAVALALSALSWIDLHNFLPLLILIFLGIFFWSALYASLLEATPFLRSVLPVFTAGELARVALSMNRAEFPQLETKSALSSSQVWDKLVRIFSEQNGCNPEEVVPSASMDNLGVD